MWAKERERERNEQSRSRKRRAFKGNRSEVVFQRGRYTLLKSKKGVKLGKIALVGPRRLTTTILNIPEQPRHQKLSAAGRRCGGRQVDWDELVTRARTIAPGTCHLLFWVHQVNEQFIWFFHVGCISISATRWLVSLESRAATL